MPTASPYQMVFRLDRPNDADHKVKKRNRQTLSCGSCKIKKLKCNRQHPCNQCSSQGTQIAAACIYGQTTVPNARTGDLHSRLQDLERMVTSLVGSSNGHFESLPQDRRIQEGIARRNDQSTPSGSPYDAAVAAVEQHAHLTRTRLHSEYHGPTNWASILENIRDMQEYLEPEPMRSAPPSRPSNDCVDIAFHHNPTLDFVEACESLPTRQVSDVLLSNIFESGNSMSPIIHTGKFFREYEAFWIDPSSASFLWLSMLYSFLWIGSFWSNGKGLDNFSHDSSRKVFYNMAAQALVAGKYHEAKQYSVEATLLHCHCKFFQQEKTGDADAWIIVGLCVRLSMKMGYHRDPRNFPNISPFEGEMRRRTFSILEIFDMLLSFKAGLPAMIHEDECDTLPPRNLLDEDFDEDCTELPSARPETERTPMLYFSYKSQFTRLLKRVMRHALSLELPPYDKTMALDADLRCAHDRVPPGLEMKPLSSLLSDTSRMLVSRLHIELLYLKSLCVLHRTYLSHERRNPVYDYSRTTCIESALRTLQLQSEFHEIGRKGGRFENDPAIAPTRTMSDFVLAAMILCLDLYEFHKESLSSGLMSPPPDVGIQRRNHHALRRSHAILLECKESADARRAATVLAAMMKKISLTPTASAADDRSRAFTEETTSTAGSFAKQTPLQANISSNHSLPPASISTQYINSNGKNLDQFLPDPSLSADFDCNFDLDMGIGALDSLFVDPISAAAANSAIADWGAMDQFIFQK